MSHLSLLRTARRVPRRGRGQQHAGGAERGIMPAPRVDIAGKRFGRLTALEPVGRSSDRSITWRCRCDCGNETIVSGSVLRRRSVRRTGKPAATLSCGCLHEASCVTHEHSRKQSNSNGEYQAWKRMRQRCLNPKYPRWQDWGGRGIKVCDRWNSFENFLADMGGRPCTASIGSTMMVTKARR